MCMPNNFGRKILYGKFFNDEGLEEVVKEYMARLKNKEFDKGLIYRKRLSKKLSEYTKAQPPHVKAALKLEEQGIEVPKIIEYYMTLNGPEPVAIVSSELDYEHYMDKQLRPLAIDLLRDQGIEFDELISGGQLSLF